jgi:hypothetical protein
MMLKRLKGNVVWPPDTAARLISADQAGTYSRAGFCRRAKQTRRAGYYHGRADADNHVN